MKYRPKLRLSFLFGLLTGVGIGFVMTKAQTEAHRAGIYPDLAIINGLQPVHSSLQNGLTEKIRPVDLEDYSTRYRLPVPKDVRNRLNDIDNAELVMFWLTMSKSRNVFYPDLDESGVTDRDRDGFPEYTEVSWPEAPLYCLSFSRVGNETLVFLNLETEAFRR